MTKDMTVQYPLRLVIVYEKTTGCAGRKAFSVFVKKELLLI